MDMELTDATQLLARFADAIETNGIELVPAALLTDVVAAARAVDVSPVVVGVLVDPTEPAVARERAFMKAAIRIIGRSDAGSSRSAMRPRLRHFELAGHGDQQVLASVCGHELHADR